MNANSHNYDNVIKKEYEPTQIKLENLGFKHRQQMINNNDSSHQNIIIKDEFSDVLNDMQYTFDDNYGHGDNDDNDNDDNDNDDDHDDGDEDEDDDEPEMIQNKTIERGRVKKKHTKSRDGCTVCKERKIRCDQRIPVCSFCERKGHECPYLMMTPFQIHRILENQRSSGKTFISSVATSISTQEIFDTNYESISSSETNSIGNSHTPQKGDGYFYRTSGKINLNSQSPYLNCSDYQVHEIESALLPSIVGNEISLEVEDEDIHNYIPLKTNYIPTDFHHLESQNNLNSLNFPLPLYSNSRISNKIFNTSHNPIFKYYNNYIQTSEKLVKYLFIKDFKSIHEFLGDINLDFILQSDYFQFLSIGQLYNKLLRKSFLLFALDHYKNIILKQGVVPFANYKAKLAIACECENNSVISIDIITKIIKDEYLPQFYEFSIAGVSLFLGSFMILDDCLGFHFKNGLKYDMSFDEGNKAIQLVGVFSTGYYTIVMERSKEQLLMSTTNILSAFLVTNFKRLLEQNYPVKVFEEFEKVVEKSNIQLGGDINFENLKLFCEKHSHLIKVNIHKHSLIGLNNGYLIRLFNSFKCITPFDICNYGQSDKKLFIDKDIEIIVSLFYFAGGNILDGLFPCLRSILSGSFCVLLWEEYQYPDTRSLMRLFNSIIDKRKKLIAIYLIRVGLFFKCQRMYFRKYSETYPIDELLNEDSGLSINERYLKLLKLKEDCLVNQIPMRSFLLDKGQFIRRWNYSNDKNLKPKRTNRVWDNKIINCFAGDEDAIIEDFKKSNNGFFTFDHNPATDLSEDNAVSEETTFIDGNQIKVLWKLTTYIRINNL
ncbi:hypothetical protein C6P40_001613 [Pichia californica]|uniref:Zn(2)-C6 fungal-type domain-containing protein n=1 Tax=Pichia californica TaxID=460514 RepID=A0A9P6WQA1_9ASCO|nr:hypothetical protein C6P40_001613 [[Candida] californica]